MLTFNCLFLVACFYLSLATCDNFYFDLNATTQCAQEPHCSFFDRNLWVNSAIPLCNGEDSVFIYSYLASPLPFILLIDPSQPTCNFSSLISNSTAPIFVIKEGTALSIGNLSYYSRLIVSSQSSVEVWDTTRIYGSNLALNVSYGGSFTHNGPQIFLSAFESIITVYGNLTINSTTQARIYGDIVFGNFSTFSAAVVSFFSSGTFGCRPIFSVSAGMYGQNYNFFLGVHADLMSISSSAVARMYGDVYIETLSVTASQIWFINTNVEIELLSVNPGSETYYTNSTSFVSVVSSLYGPITVNSSTVSFMNNNVQVPSLASSLSFGGNSTWISDILIMLNVGSSDTGINGEPTNVSINADLVSAMTGSHYNLSFCTFIAGRMLVDTVLVKSVTANDLEVTISMTTYQGLYVNRNFVSFPAYPDESQTMQLNSNVFFGEHAVVQLNYSTITGNISISGLANVLLSNCTITGNILISDLAATTIFSSTIMGNISITRNSNAHFQDTSIYGNLQNNSTLEVAGILELKGNFTQLSNGNLIFKQVDFSGPSISDNHFYINESATLAGNLRCNIVKNPRFYDWTKQLYLIDFQTKNGTFYNIDDLYDSTKLDIQYHDHSIAISMDILQNIFSLPYIIFGCGALLMIGLITYAVIDCRRRCKKNLRFSKAPSEETPFATAQQYENELEFYVQNLQSNVKQIHSANLAEGENNLLEEYCEIPDEGDCNSGENKMQFEWNTSQINDEVMDSMHDVQNVESNEKLLNLSHSSCKLNFST